MRNGRAAVDYEHCEAGALCYLQLQAPERPPANVSRIKLLWEPLEIPRQPTLQDLEEHLCRDLGHPI